MARISPGRVRSGTNSTRGAGNRQGARRPSRFSRSVPPHHLQLRQEMSLIAASPR
jgi:hypothetical protein